MYHITITDIKTGEVTIDQDTDALIASVRVENGVRGMTLLDACATDVARVVDVATRTTARVLSENPPRGAGPVGAPRCWGRAHGN